MNSSRESDSAVFPHVSVVALKEGEGRKFATVHTTAPNTADIDVAVYWHIPDDPNEQPYLVVDVDAYGVAPLKVCVNDYAVHDSSY